MPRLSDDVLVGGGRVFLDGQDIGWLQGEMSLEEQGDALTIKESEGGTVVTIQNDQEVHFTFNLLEANLDTLRLLNPSYIVVPMSRTKKGRKRDLVKNVKDRIITHTFRVE